MRIIDAQIQWYEQNSTSLYDDVVRIELKKINDLYEAYKDCANEMFVKEMMEAFCKIIEKQRERIADLETESDSMTGTFAGGSTTVHQYMPGGFLDDKHLQEAFTFYCLSKGKSSYTVNDYCLRIKNLWKSFIAEYEQGSLPEELEIDEKCITPDTPLVNAFYHTEELNCYVSMKIACLDEKRNWATTRAAFHKFEEFKASVEAGEE